MMMSEASYWIARRFNAPDAQLFVGGYGAVLAGFAVGAATAGNADTPNRSGERGGAL